MTVRAVRIADYFDKAYPLMLANWRETGMDFEFKPDRSFYERTEELGVLVALGAFRGDELVGYSTATVYEHPFNRQVKVCSSDALYVKPEARSTMLGARLIIETELAAQEKGANWIMWHTRAGTPLAGVLGRRGYDPMDVVMARGL